MDRETNLTTERSAAAQPLLSLFPRAIRHGASAAARAPLLDVLRALRESMPASGADEALLKRCDGVLKLRQR